MSVADTKQLTRDIKSYTKELAENTENLQEYARENLPLKKTDSK
jgi:hypothetical protein